MKLDTIARQVAMQAVVAVAAMILVAHLRRRWPALRQLTDPE